MSTPIIQEGRVTSRDGTSIFYRSEGSGPPLIFCYGLTCGPWHFDYQLAHFKKDYQVIIVDYRGHNNSHMPKNYTDLTVRGCAEDIQAVVEHLKLEKAVFVGHSLGVSVIVDLTSMIPEKMAGIALICGSITNPFKTLFNTEWSRIGFELTKSAYLNLPSMFNLVFKHVVPSSLGHAITSAIGFNKTLSQTDDIQKYIEGVSKHPPETFLYILQNLSNFDGTHLLEKIKCPTLIFGGENDLITPIEHQELMHKKIPNSQFVKIPYASHCSHIDMPEFINLKIEQWLREINWR